VFSLLVLALCVLVPWLCAVFAALDVGYAVGPYADSQTISASIGVAIDQIQRSGVSTEQAAASVDAIPTGYAVTYIFGTIGSAMVLAQLGPKLIGVDLPAACADYEKQLGGGVPGVDPGALHAYRQTELRAYRIPPGDLTGKPVRVPPNPHFDYYYGLIDLEFWLRKYGGDDVVAWIKKNVHPLDIAFRLAEDHGIVLLNGGGFDAPDWSVRVSFANLDDHVYDDIGRAVRAVARVYVDAYQAEQKSGKLRKTGTPKSTRRPSRKEKK
jgi:Predicted Permease Membrane Region